MSTFHDPDPSPEHEWTAAALALLVVMVLVWLTGCYRAGVSETFYLEVKPVAKLGASSDALAPAVEHASVNVRLADGTLVTATPSADASMVISWGTGTTPLPPQESATSFAGPAGAGADSGAAAWVSQTLGQLGVLVWLGAGLILAGFAVLVVWFRLRINPAWTWRYPWWIGPGIAAIGGGFIAAPYFLELAMPVIVWGGTGLLVALLALAALLVWRNRKALEKRWNLDIDGGGIGK